MKRLKSISVILFCAYIAAVLLLCLIRTESLPKLPKFFLGIPLDKITHFLMFLPFTILGYMVFYTTERSIMREFAVIGILCVIGAGFALSTERLQAMTAYRSCEAADLIADLIGIAAGAFAVTFEIFRKHR